MNTNTSKITLHRAETRGGGEYGWLKTRYSFSFSDWYNPSRMGFGALRVINDDTVEEGKGFPTHSHNNMEIISIVTEGVIAHKDSMGSVGTVSPGEVQVMSAGSGVQHSEYNGGKGDLKLFQIWITSDARNVAPRYDQRKFELNESGQTLLVAPIEKKESHEGALNIHQDAYITRLTPGAGSSLKYTLKNKEHGVYFFVIDGEVEIEGEKLRSRDAIGVEYVESVTLGTTGKVDVLAIEVPMK